MTPVYPPSDIPFKLHEGLGNAALVGSAAFVGGAATLKLSHTLEATLFDGFCPASLGDRGIFKTALVLAVSTGTYFVVWPTLLAMMERLPFVAKWRKEASIPHALTAWFCRTVGISAAIAMPALISQHSDKQIKICAVLILSGALLYVFTPDTPLRPSKRK